MAGKKDWKFFDFKNAFVLMSWQIRMTICGHAALQETIEKLARKTQISKRNNIKERNYNVSQKTTNLR
jgi:hypothetical protein